MMILGILLVASNFFKKRNATNEAFSPIVCLWREVCLKWREKEQLNITNRNTPQNLR